jgi:hypothetical protein
MTAVFRYRPDTDAYRALVAVSADTYDRLKELGSEPLKQWTPPRLRWIGSGEKGDFPNLAGHVPVVSDRALEVLRPLLGEDVDVLPLDIPGGGYAALHVRDFPDCLDTQASDVRWLEPGLAYDVVKYEFDAECLEGHHLFRLPQLALVRTFLSGAAMDRIRQAGLVGLREARVWEG